MKCLTVHPDFFNEYSLEHCPLMNHTNHMLKITESKNFGDITDALNIEKSAVTKIIKRLSTMRIVEIQRGHDKREKITV